MHLPFQLHTSCTRVWGGTQRLQGPTGPWGCQTTCLAKAKVRKKTGKPYAKSLRPSQPNTALQPAQPQLATGSTPVTVTGPIPVTTEQYLTGQDRLADPWWSTFCGVTNGCWFGRAAAFSPYDGKPEPMALNEDRKKVYDMHTLTIEQRDADGDSDKVIRRTMRTQAVEQLALGVPAAITADGAVTAPAQAPGSDEQPAWEYDEFGDGQEGLVFFDGGAFSRGPFHLTHGDMAEASSSVQPGAATDNGSGPLAEMSSRPNTGGQEPAESQEDPGTSDDWDLDEGLDEGLETLEAEADVGDADGNARKTSVIEQCVTLGGEERIRLQITVAATGGTEAEELDVELLRVALYMESWEGLSEGICEATHSSPRPALSEAPRLLPQDLLGSWRVFTIAGLPITETDLLTGLERKINVFHSQETEQRWGRPPKDPSIDGGTFWLPGKALLSLAMVPAVNGTGHRGLSIRFSWMARDNMLIGVEREYDATGELTEVRTQTALRDGWVGGRM